MKNPGKRKKNEYIFPRKETTTIKFEYYREWESQSPRRTKEIKVKVIKNKQATFDIPKPLDIQYVSSWDGNVKVLDPMEEEVGIGRNIECEQE